MYKIHTIGCKQVTAPALGKYCILGGGLEWQRLLNSRLFLSHVEWKLLKRIQDLAGRGQYYILRRRLATRGLGICLWPKSDTQTI